MIRHKTMLIFKAIFLVFALGLIAPSEARNIASCVYCDKITGKKYTDCVTGSLAVNVEFQNLKPQIQKMTTDLENIAKDMNIDGPMKDNVMKGALGNSLASIVGEDITSNKKISIIINILKYCFGVVNKVPDLVFLSDCKMMAEEQRNSSILQQEKKQTQSDQAPGSIQNDNNPPQYSNVPQTQVISKAIAFSKNNNTPSSKENQGNPLVPDKQNSYPYNNVYQQQGSVAAASAYSGWQKNQWAPNPYNDEQAQKQNYFQQSPTSQGTANNIALSKASSYASSVYKSPPPKQQPPNLYIPNAQQRQSGNDYNEQQNYQVNPNTNRGVYYKDVNNPSYPQIQTPVIRNNGGNSQQYTSNSGYYLENKNPSTNNWPYSQGKYIDNQFSWSNAQADALAYSNARQQNNNFYNQQYPSLSMSAPPQGVPLYPSLQTNQRKPNPNVLTTNDKSQPDTEQQNVPSTKDDTSNDAVFSETLYSIICDSPSVIKVINEKTTTDQFKAILKYIILYGLNVCGYPKDMAQKCADDSNNFANALPQGLPTSIQVKAICEMMKIQLISANMIGDNPAAQAQCLGNGIIYGLQELEKSLASLIPQQNVPTYFTKNVNYYDSNSNNNAANPQGVPSKQINNITDQDPDDNPVSYDENKTIKPNKNSDQSNVDTDSNISNNNDNVGYLTTQTPQTGKKPYSYDNNDQSSAFAASDAGAFYYDGEDDDFDDDFYDDEEDAVDADFYKISTQSPNLPTNKPNVYNVNDQTPDDEFKQQANQQQLFNYQQEKTMDNDFTKDQDKPTDLKGIDTPPLQLNPTDLKGIDTPPLQLNPTDLKGTDAPPLQLNPTDVPQNSNSMKSNTEVMSIADSQDRVTMLVKLALECFKDGDFDFKSYSKGIAIMASMTSKKHPEMGTQEAKTLTLVDCIYALITILKTILKGNPDLFQQLQTTDAPLQVLQNTPPKYQNTQKANSNSDDQTKITTKNPQTIIQGKSVNLPAIQQISPVNNVPESPPQNQGLQSDQRRNVYNTNQNSDPLNQPQTKPAYPTSAPQQTTSNLLQTKGQYKDWNAGNQAWQKNQNSVPSLNSNVASTPQLVQPNIQDMPQRPLNNQPPTLPQNQAIQNNQWRNDYNSNQNSYLPIQNNFAPQAKPTNINPIPQSTSSNVPQSKPQNSNWYDNNQAQQNSQNTFFQFSNTPKQFIIPQQSTFQQPPIFPQQSTLQQPSIIPQQSTLQQPPIISQQSTFQQPPVIPQQSTLQQSPIVPQPSMLQLPPIVPPQLTLEQQSTSPQQLINPFNGNNFQNFPGNQAGFQQDRMSNPNGMQNENQFAPNFPQNNVNMAGAGQPGNQQFSDPSFPNLEQNMNQQRGPNALGNQGFGGAGQTVNYQQNPFPVNNAPFQRNQWN